VRLVELFSFYFIVAGRLSIHTIVLWIPQNPDDARSRPLFRKLIDYASHSTTQRLICLSGKPKICRWVLPIPKIELLDVAYKSDNGSM